MKRLSKKGETLSLTSVPWAIIMLVVLAILLGLGASILGSMQTSQCTGTVGSNTYYWNATSRLCNMLNSTGDRVSEVNGNIAFNSSGQGVTGVNTMAQWVPTISIVLAASVVIGLVMAYLVGRRND